MTQVMSSIDNAFAFSHRFLASFATMVAASLGSQSEFEGIEIIYSCTKKTALSFPTTSQTPSEAKIRNSSMRLKLEQKVWGLLETPTLCAYSSPSERLIASPVIETEASTEVGFVPSVQNHTRSVREDTFGYTGKLSPRREPTRPPAFSIRSLSGGVLGL